MTSAYVLSPRAHKDIEDIWNYTVTRWGADQAEFYIRQLAAHLDFVAAQPNVARACPEVRTGYYKYPSGSHYIFFRLMKGGIDVARILHERMNFEQHFE